MEDVGFIRCPLNTSLHIRESGFWNPEKLCLWNRNPENLFFVESGILGFGIRNKAQGIRNPLCIGIRNPSCSGFPGNLESKTWNPKSTAWNPESNTVGDSLNGGAIKQVSLNNTIVEIPVSKMPA